ncbi:hypothetical protein [Bergeyella zoohelcum]|uniref:hypothetical protein n=1 Tax=Bergeyella zoohelcum TaxID=1015 RepID=UPI0037351194
MIFFNKTSCALKSLSCVPFAQGGVFIAQDRKFNSTPCAFIAQDRKSDSTPYVLDCMGGIVAFRL